MWLFCSPANVGNERGGGRLGGVSRHSGGFRPEALFPLARTELFLYHHAHMDSVLASGPFRPCLSPALFAFDLDATITTRELLPCLAECLGIAGEMTAMTRRAVNGDIPFADSFRERFAMLRSIPLEMAHACVASVPLDPHIEAFIKKRPEDCAVLTGNLDLWVLPLRQKLPCRWFCSQGELRGRELRLVSILDKGQATRQLKREGRPVIAIGESANDVPMFRQASCGIAFAGVHTPAREILSLARYAVDDGRSLCVLLETLLSKGGKDDIAPCTKSAAPGEVLGDGAG